MTTSTQKLVAALRRAKAPEEMIQKAEKDYYHDFKSPLATPLIELVQDLHVASVMNPGLQAIRDLAMHGEFDATDAEWKEMDA